MNSHIWPGSLPVATMLPTEVDTMAQDIGSRVSDHILRCNQLTKCPLTYEVPLTPEMQEKIWTKAFCIYEEEALNLPTLCDRIRLRPSLETWHGYRCIIEH